jgi:hypothetical protein
LTVTVGLGTWPLTEGEDELDACDSFPAHTIGSSGECLVYTGGNDSSSVEEQLQRDDHETTERSRDNLRLVGAELDVSVSPEPRCWGVNSRHINFDQTDRDINNDTANNELCEPSRSEASVGRSDFD